MRNNYHLTYFKGTERHVSHGINISALSFIQAVAAFDYDHPDDKLISIMNQDLAYGSESLEHLEKVTQE